MSRVWFVCLFDWVVSFQHTLMGDLCNVAVKSRAMKALYHWADGGFDEHITCSLGMRYRERRAVF